MEAVLVILTLGAYGVLIAAILTIFRISKDTTEIRKMLNEIKEAIDNVAR